MFNNPELQKIYEDSKPVVEAHLKKLNDLCKDIKLMEDNLSRTGLSETPEYTFDDATLSFFSGRIWCRRGGRKDILISMKIADRLAMKKHLPEFFRRCIEKLKTEIPTEGEVAVE